MKLFPKFFLILFLLSCYHSEPQIKVNNFNGSDLLGKNILLIPINLSETRSGLFKNEKVTDFEERIISFNEEIRIEIIERLKYFKVNLEVLTFSKNNIPIFNELYEDLKKNHSIIQEKKAEKIGLEVFSIQPNEREKELNRIYYQPNLQKLEKLDISSQKKENEPDANLSDFILLYRINYYSDSDGLRITKATAMSVLIVMALAFGNGQGLNANSPGSIFERGEIQFILIDNRNKKVVSFGNFFTLYKNEKKLNKKVIQNFVNYLFGLNLEDN